MAKLNSTVDKVTRILVREMVKSQKTGIISTWKTRKVISIAKWNEMLYKTDLKKKMEYIPEDYIDSTRWFSPKNELEQNMIDEWFRDWKDYLHEKQKPLFGNFV